MTVVSKIRIVSVGTSPSVFQIKRLNFHIFYQSQVHVKAMKLISAIFIFQLAQSRVKNQNLDELTDRISTDELLKIREKYCQSIGTGKHSEFCLPGNDDFPSESDWMPPGFLLFILSLVRERFQTSLIVDCDKLRLQ